LFGIFSLNLKQKRSTSVICSFTSLHVVTLFQMVGASGTTEKVGSTTARCSRNHAGYMIFDSTFALSFILVSDDNIACDLMRSFGMFCSISGG
jgi:hypothetical protein